MSFDASSIWLYKAQKSSTVLKVIIERWQSSHFLFRSTLSGLKNHNVQEFWNLYGTMLKNFVKLQHTLIGSVEIFVKILIHVILSKITCNGCLMSSSGDSGLEFDVSSTSPSEFVTSFSAMTSLSFVTCNIFNGKNSKYSK